MTRVLTLKLAIVSGVFVILLAAGLAYAGLDREFDLPVQATVTVRIESPAQAADVNGDGKVDGADLRNVAQNLGMEVAGDVRADVDKNQVIDIFDLVFVALHYNG